MMRPGWQVAIEAELAKLRTEALERRATWPEDPVAAALERAAQRVADVITALRDPVRTVLPEEWIRLRGLEVTPQSVRAWCRTGRLPARRSFRGWEIPVSAPVPCDVRAGR